MKAFILLLILVTAKFAWAEAWPIEDEELIFRNPDARTLPKPEEGDSSPRRDRPRKRRRGNTQNEEMRPYRNAEPSDVDERIVEEANPPPRPRRQPPKNPWDDEPQEREVLPPETDREVANVEPVGVSADEMPPDDSRPVARANFIRLGLIGGLSSVSAGGDTTQSFRQEQALTQNFAIGTWIDGRFAEYFGAELDAYYGIAPAITLTEAGGASRTKSLQQKGIFLNVKAQFPLSAYLWPRIGLGYASMGVSHAESSGTAASTTDESISGAFATLGVELNASKALTFLVDFGMTLGASGAVVNDSGGGAELTSASLTRLRLGGFYRFTTSILGGLMLNLRSMGADPIAAAGSGVSTEPLGPESFTQVFALLMLEL